MNVFDVPLPLYKLHYVMKKIEKIIHALGDGCVPSYGYGAVQADRQAVSHRDNSILALGLRKNVEGFGKCV